ncbi:MAG: hypothetical protein MI723_16440 [Caulobacterales bacterium]|nr:hypothetical protein [Caulobacterales bacterium]
MSRSRARRRLDAFDAAFLAVDEPVEPPAARRRRMRQKAKDGKAMEVDRSGSVGRLERAAKRLKHAKAAERVLRVPQWDMPQAVEAMRRAGVSGLVTNLCGTRRMRVSARRG